MLLRRLGWLPDEWIQTLSRLMFQFGLPFVLFLGATRVDYSGVLQARYLMAGALATLLVVLLAEVYGRCRGFAAAERGIFVQAAYRSNLGVIGISLCTSAYGEAGLALAALPVALLTVFYNIIAVLVLSAAFGKSSSPLAVIGGILRNPLIIGISLGVLVAVTRWQLPGFIREYGGEVSAVILPLSLICIGASLDIKLLRRASALTVEAVSWRLLLAPLLSVVLAIQLGISGMELGVLFLLLSSPVAVASFVMVMAAGGSGPMAANIVVITTLVSSVTVTLGFALLQGMGLAA
jgi:predicted permease